MSRTPVEGAEPIRRRNSDDETSVSSETLSQAVDDGVFGRLLAPIDHFTVVPGTLIDRGDHVVVLGRYGGAMKVAGAKLDSPFYYVFQFAAARCGVPALHRQCPVDTFDEIVHAAWSGALTLAG